MNIAPEEMPREIARLEDENERLQEELKYTISIVEHNQTIQSNINSYNKLAKHSEELEDRIDKAIEYIEQQKLHKFQDTTGGLTYEERKLLEILKGE